MQRETAVNIARALGQRLFDNHGRDAKARAQFNLEGRSFWATDENLKHHKSRIVGALPMMEGAFLRLLEVTAADYENTRRVYRCVLFDLQGHHAYFVRLEDAFRTKEAALKHFEQWLGSFDPVEYYRQELKRHAENRQQQADNLLALSRSLAQEVEA